MYLLLAAGIPSYQVEGCNRPLKRITVVGVAEDDKHEAVVVSETGRYYILEGLEEWEERYHGKRVRVTGKLKVEVHERQSTDSVQVQERVGTWYIIKNPRWVLAE